uniref:DUF4455 domain-containing protein n=1 Tax=Hydatigena taeniaeformis TaxID=6205 RepID=A0A0R3WT34_HYDTA
LIISYRKKVQGRQDLEEAFGAVDALMIEVSTYFDAIESDLGSAKVDLVKRGIAMFEDLDQTLNARLPNDMNHLREVKDAINCLIPEHLERSQLIGEFENKVALAEERYAMLLRRKITIEKESKKVLARLQSFEEFTDVLQSVVSKAKAQLLILKDGPKVYGKSAPKDLETMKSWHSDCDDLVSLINSCQNEARGLQLLLSDSDLKAPPGCVEVQKEYDEVHGEISKLLTKAGALTADFALFKEHENAVELALQEIKLPTSKSPYGSRQNLRASSAAEMSRRTVEIENQLHVKPRITDILHEMQACCERASAIGLFGDIVQLLHRELDGLKKRSDLAFAALLSEQDEITKSLKAQSEMEDTLQSAEDWLALMESQVKLSSVESSVLQENIHFYQKELTRLTNLYKEISSTGSQRISSLLSKKEELSDEVIRERKRRLKVRYNELMKMASQERDQSSKALTAWNELEISVNACNALLNSAEGRLDRAEDGSVDQEVESLKEALQTMSRKDLQNQRILEVVDTTKRTF